MVEVNVHVLNHLKEELACAADKCYVKISYSTKELKNKAVLNLKQCCIHCYMALSNIF